MIFTRSDFYNHVFQPYNEAVKYGKYKKIEYSVWRTIRDWCCLSQYDAYDIELTRIVGGYNISLYSKNKVCPEACKVVWAPGSVGAFAEYLNDKELDYLAYDKDMRQSLADALSSSLTVFNNDCDVVIKHTEIDSRSNAYAMESPNYLTVGGVSFTDKINTLETTLNDIINQHTEKEKEDTMKFNFDFGPVDSSIRMSLYGMAIKNASGTYVAYDTKSKQIMDVDILNFEGANKFIYKMPAAIKDVRSGDVIIHARKPMFVLMVSSDGRLKVLDIYDGEEKTIVPSRSPFGFDFITKVVSLMDMTGVANAENPFGNMLPFLLMSDNKNSEDLLPMLLMTQNGMMAQNPMLMYMLMSKDNKDMLPFLFMMNQPHTCRCGCHEDNTDK